MGFDDCRVFSLRFPSSRAPSLFVHACNNSSISMALRQPLTLQSSTQRSDDKLEAFKLLHFFCWSVHIPALRATTRFSKFTSRRSHVSPGISVRASSSGPRLVLSGLYHHAFHIPSVTVRCDAQSEKGRWGLPSQLPQRSRPYNPAVVASIRKRGARLPRAGLKPAGAVA